MGRSAAVGSSLAARWPGLWPVVVALGLALVAAGATAVPERGKLFVQGFSPEDYGGNQQNWDTAIDRRGVVYVVNTEGILEFDGVRWRQIDNPRNLRFWSIAVAGDGTVYAGASGDLGFLAADAAGVLRFNSLRDRVPAAHLDFGEVRQVLPTADGVYFRDKKERIFLWGGEPPAMKVWRFEADPLESYLYLEEVAGRMLLARRTAGLFELRDDAFDMLAGGEALAGRFVMAILTLAEEAAAAGSGAADRLLVYTFRDGLYLGQAGAFIPWRTEAGDFAREHLARAGGRLADGRLVLATLRGGLALFDAAGRLLEVVDGESGLPDNGVLSRGTEDGQGGLWLPLNNGVARVEVGSSLRFWDAGQGLDGSVMAVRRHRGTLYVGSTRGLYTLEAAVAGPARFRPIAGVLQECWQLAEVGGQLFAATSDGLFAVAGPGVLGERLVSGVTFSVAGSADGSRLYAGSQHGGLRAWAARGGRWAELPPASGTSPDVRAIVGDGSGRLWLRGLDRQRVERIERVDLRTGEVRAYGAEAGLPPREELNPFLWRGGIYVGGTGGLYRFDAGVERFVADRSLADESLAVQYPAVDGAGRLWFFAGEGLAVRAEADGDGAWRLSQPLARTRTLTYWTLYPEAGGSVVWAGSDAGRLLRWTDGGRRPDGEAGVALIRRVITASPGGGLIFGGSAGITAEPPALPYARNAVRFEYALPRFDAHGANRYQSRLVGLDETWSDWSAESYRDFTSLFEGRYRFEVRGRDVYGALSEPAAFELKILAPWYRSAWAYLGYSLALAVAISGIVRWRARHARRRMAALEHEIAARRRINVELEQTNAELERFVYTVSHDLKTPLVTIRGFLGAAQKDLDSGNFERARRDMTRVYAAAGRMGHLLEDLLELGRIGRLMNDPEAVDLGELAREAVEQVAGPIAARGVEVEVATALAVVTGDRLRLLEVLQNLIANAVKFMGEQPAPRVEVGCRRDRGEIVCFVRDNGIGIDPRYHEKVFGLFERLDQTIDGTGIGLALVKRIVEVHGGRVWVESAGAGTGAGATFYFTLPSG